MEPNTNCEACLGNGPILEVRDADQREPYRVCSQCSEKLENNALRPIEWFRLASIHGWSRYLLHDDFYDENGASFEVGPVSEPSLKAPTLAQSSASVEALFSYCMTRWSIEESAYSSFAQHTSEDILVEAQARTKGDNVHALQVGLQIAANALGTFAAEWVRDKYNVACKHEILFWWSEAAAKCMPAKEGLDLAIRALAPLEKHRLAEKADCLIWFRSKAVLKWIEERCPHTDVGEQWGRLASVSELSWDIVVQWLSLGRPLSLIAIDALRMMIPTTPSAPVIVNMRPTLLGAPDAVDVEHALQRYLFRDSAPRVTQRCRYVIENLDRMSTAS